MARQLEIVLADSEDIVYYECNLMTGIVKVLVGIGTTDKDGKFIAQNEQTLQSYTITSDKFDALMAAKENKPAGVFRKEDLWVPVDEIRIEKVQIADEISLNETTAKEKIQDPK